MKQITNRFGTGTMYDENDLGDSIYCVCTACMSVWSDFLSFANDTDGDERIIDSTYMDGITDTIIVLGCQVTDLAILNDLQKAEELHKLYPEEPIYMGGCLAYRFDIELPSWLKRLKVVRREYQDLEYIENVLEYAKPFWNKNLKPDDDELTEGNLFRHMYPLKIGAGCSNKCKYCTIRDTRGESYETDAFLQIHEFLNHDDVVIISDSPTTKQLKEWCYIATRYNKPISFRNVEPQIAVSVRDELISLSEKGLLRIFHCPVQSTEPEVLKAMNRAVEPTIQYIYDVRDKLKANGTIVATNIIIDYEVNGEIKHNFNEKELNELFDYVSWNPYFDGHWNRAKAEQRFKKYIK